MTPELQSQIAIWRQKEADGTMTLEDYRLAVRALREDRQSAATASATKRAKAKAAIPNANDLLSELGL